jgi:hypothetical protein
LSLRVSANSAKVMIKATVKALRWIRANSKDAGLD